MDRPASTSAMTTAEKTTTAETIALAARHISASVAFFSFSLKMGMNAAVSAPSPSRRRKRLGIVKASVNAPATGPSPMNRA